MKYIAAVLFAITLSAQPADPQLDYKQVSQYARLQRDLSTATARFLQAQSQYQKESQDLQAKMLEARKSLEDVCVKANQVWDDTDLACHVKPVAKPPSK